MVPNTTNADTTIEAHENLPANRNDARTTDLKNNMTPEDKEIGFIAWIIIDLLHDRSIADANITFEKHQNLPVEANARIRAHKILRRMDSRPWPPLSALTDQMTGLKKGQSNLKHSLEQSTSQTSTRLTGLETSINDLISMLSQVLAAQAPPPAAIYPNESDSTAAASNSPPQATASESNEATVQTKTSENGTNPTTLAPSSRGDAPFTTTSDGTRPTTSPHSSMENVTLDTTDDGTNPTVSAPSYRGDVPTSRTINEEHVEGRALI